MKVLHVLHTIDPAGAGPVEAARLYSSASRPGYHPEILSLDDDVSPWSDSWAVPVHAIGHNRAYPRYSQALVPWLNRHASRFDAMVVHGVWGYHLIGVWMALRRTGIPYFVVLHGMLNPWFKRTYPWKHLKKTAAWRVCVGRAVRDAAGILYLCEEERRLAQSNFPIACRIEAFARLGTPVSDSRPDVFLDRFPHLRSKRIVLFLGRICYMKGCDLLLEAFAAASADCPSAHLAICGTDREHWQAELIHKARDLGLATQVTWTGPLYGGIKSSALAAAELFVLPSRCETFPISVIEALACGTPVLVTRDVNIYPEIETSGGGLVCDTTVDSICDSLGRWLALDESARNAARTRARKCHSRHFGLALAIDEHVSAIRECLPQAKQVCPAV